MAKRRFFVPFIGLALIGAVYAYVAFWPCEILIPMFDSKQLEAAEAAELWPALQQNHSASVEGKVPYESSLGILPKPIKVISVFGRWASIKVNGPMPIGLLEAGYGDAWQKVYARHHAGGPLTCVYIHYSWTGGGASSMCCMAPF